MCPTLFTIPWLNLPIRGYGLMLMIAFLSGTWWASRRAAQVKQDPDLVVNLGFVALLCSVVGARIFYVVHYWERFRGHSVWEMVNLTAGGLEFYGGFIGGMVGVLTFLLVKRVSIRLYFDILAPSLMLGMAFARIGCFLNGCCWGAPAPLTMPWAVHFPYASPPQVREWEDRIMTLPAELIVVPAPELAHLVGPLPRDWVDSAGGDNSKVARQLADAKSALTQAKASGADSATLARLSKQVDKAQKIYDLREQPLVRLRSHAQRFNMEADALVKLANQPEYRSVGVHPAQIYASLDGLVVALLLSAIFYRRKRHGIVFGLTLLLYPLCRICEEMIRIDNPHDTAGMTISQFVSVMIMLIGAAWLIAIYRQPLRSPHAVPFVWPPEPQPVRRGHSRKKGR